MDPEDFEEVDDVDDDDDDDDDDFEDLGEEPAATDGEIRPERRPAAPGNADLIRERKAVRRELERVRAQMTADDVLLRMRRQQAAELGNSALECEESIEQARTWIRALEDVLQKRAAKLAEHDARRTKSAQQVSESERALELLEEEERRNQARHVQDQASLSNTVKVPSPPSLATSHPLHCFHFPPPPLPPFDPPSLPRLLAACLPLPAFLAQAASISHPPCGVFALAAVHAPRSPSRSSRLPAVSPLAHGGPPALSPPSFHSRALPSSVPRAIRDYQARRPQISAGTQP